MSRLKEIGKALRRSSAVRLAARYVILYMLLAAGLSGALYVWYSMTIGREHVAFLEREIERVGKAYEKGGIEETIHAIGETSKENSFELMYLLESADGKHRSGTLRTLPWEKDDEIPAEGTVQKIWVDEEALPTDKFDEDAYLPVIWRRWSDGTRAILAVTTDQSPFLVEAAEYLIESLPVAFLIAVAVALSVGLTMWSRVSEINLTTQKIMTGDLAQRVPIRGRGDELDILAGRLNEMLERIQQLVRGMRDVTDNIAHDLRSPLTRLRSRLEVTLLEPRSSEEYRKVMSESIEDTAALLRTFNALLGIAQAESGQRRAAFTNVRLSELVAPLIELYRGAAEERGQTLEFESDGKTEIFGSRELVAQALSNLLENAIKYTQRGGRITVGSRTRDNRAELSVTDTGPGIPEAERTSVLERTVRLENARRTPGNGLGLSLVRAICTLHSADLLLEDGKPGLLVTIRFRQVQ